MKKLIFIGLIAVFMATAVGVSFAKSVYRKDPPEKANFDVNCVKPAVEKRETAIIASYDKMSACAKTALTQRKTSVFEAWGKTDNVERRTMRNTAWTAFTKAKRACQQIYKAEVKATWKLFHEETKSCKVVTRGAEPEEHDSRIEE
ncbi:MAG: hypothetical protein V1905_03915 [bacterium]